MPADRVNGTALRIIRERSEMTVGQLVEAVREEGIDVHPDHLRNIELGYKQPSPKLLAAIARALRVPKVALLADADEKAAATSTGSATIPVVGSVLIALELLLLISLLGIGAR